MKLLIATLAALSLCGCATLSKITTPTAQPFVQAAVAVAVATAVGTNVASQKAKALQIKGIAQQLLAVDEGATVPLTQLESLVNAKILAMKLPQGDVLAAELLTAALTAAVQAEITGATNGAVSPTTQAAVATILNDVITATAAYGV